MATYKEPSGNNSQWESLRVLVVDDHPVVREGLRAILRTGGIEVIGEAANGKEAVERALELKPDVILMDVNVPEMGGFAATRIIKETISDASVIVIACCEGKEEIRCAFEAGASGYLFKSASAQDVIQAVKLVKAGVYLVGNGLAAELLHNIPSVAHRSSDKEADLADLTPREHEVLALLAQGLTNKEIALTMYFSVGTVKNLVQRIIAKVGAANRTQAVAYAVRAGLGKN